MTPQDTRRLSKKLSLLLRHRPELYQLELDEHGWCEVDALLSAFRQNGEPLGREALQVIVEHNDKKRFAFSPDGLRIRASQGHSVRINLGYEPIRPPDVLYHGTATRFLDAILRTGLTKQSRHHVHLSADEDTAAQVGSRHGKLVILKVEAAAMHRDGLVFYQSENGVWLTDSVPVRYLTVPTSELEK